MKTNLLLRLKVSKALQVKIRVPHRAKIIPKLQLLKTLAHTQAIKLQLLNHQAQTKINQANPKIKQATRAQNTRKPTIRRKYRILLISRIYRRERVIPRLLKRQHL